MLIKRFSDMDSWWACLLHTYAAGLIMVPACTPTMIIPTHDSSKLLTSYNFGATTVLFIPILIRPILLQALWLSKPASSEAAHASGGGGNHHHAPNGSTPSLDAEKGAAAASTELPEHGHERQHSTTTDTFVAAPSSRVQLPGAFQFIAYIILGVSIGVMTSSRLGVLLLLIAIAVHQGLEGLILGRELDRANRPRWKQLLMLVLFAIATPVGIAIGISVAQSYDPASHTAQAVQDFMNGVFGTLIYITLGWKLSNMLENLSKKMFWATFAALLFGGASMAALSIWGQLAQWA